MLRENKLAMKVLLFLVLLFGIGSSNLFAGDITEFNRMRLVKSDYLIWSNFWADELAVGASKTVSIQAKSTHNYTNIYLRKDKKYKFTVSSSDQWNNNALGVNAGGYSSLNPLDINRRQPSLNMMAMVGEFFSANNSNSYLGKFFLIGLGRSSYTAATTGYLVVFANDCAACYLDNYGSISLTVTRLQ